VNDLGKVAVIAAIMGAILLVGVIVAPLRGGPTVEPIVVEEESPEEVTILQEDTLELLDPVYSEKAVFQDGTIRIAFDASYTDAGLQSRLPFWLHNVSGSVINVLWDRCSIQLPGGNTVKILSEQALGSFGGSGGTIAIAPSGDLFDAIIPVSEFVWDGDTDWSVSTGILDAGTFTLVLAIECAEPRARAVCEQAGKRVIGPDGCEVAPERPVIQRAIEHLCEGRSIVYYTFRFIVR